MLAETFVRAEGAFPLIGVGGIDSPAAAIAKIKAGATLLQLYSGLVFRGIGLIAEIKADTGGRGPARQPRLARRHGRRRRRNHDGGKLAELSAPISRAAR